MQARSYARGGGLLAKTDRIDARLLALFAQREQPVPRPPLDAETQALQELATRRDQLLEMRVAEQQRLKRSSAQVRKELRQHIAYLEGRITQIDDDIDKTVRRSKAWRRKSEVLRSFPGVGKVFCTTGGCRKFRVREPYNEARKGRRKVWQRTGKKGSRMRCWTNFWRGGIRRRFSKPAGWSTS